MKRKVLIALLCALALCCLCAGALAEKITDSEELTVKDGSDDGREITLQIYPRNIGCSVDYSLDENNYATSFIPRPASSCKFVGYRVCEKDNPVSGVSTDPCSEFGSETDGIKYMSGMTHPVFTAIFEKSNVAVFPAGAGWAYYDYIEEAFMARPKEGYRFLGWKYSDGSTEPVGYTSTDTMWYVANPSTTGTYTAYFEKLAECTLSPADFTLTQSGYTDIPIELTSLALRMVWHSIDKKYYQAEAVSFRLHGGTLTDAAGHSIPFQVADENHAAHGDGAFLTTWHTFQGRTDIMPVWIDDSDFEQAAPGIYTGTLTYNAQWKCMTGTVYVTIPYGSGQIALTLVVPDSTHTHSFTYTVNGATITASCSAGNCPLTDGKATLTIAAPTLTVYGGAGKAGASLTGLEAFNAATGKAIAETDIRYVGSGSTTYTESATAPTGAGDYTAKIAVGGQTASVNYWITKAGLPEIVQSSPTLYRYTGDDIPINAIHNIYKDKGMVYCRLGASGDWSGEIPKVRDVAEYTLQYYVIGDDNHNNLGNIFDPSEYRIIVEAVPASVENAPTARALTHNGSALELVNAGLTNGGTLFYALGENPTTAPVFDGTSGNADSTWSRSVPTATDVGTYYVWYKVVGDANHTDSKAACVTVTISDPYVPPVTNYYTVSFVNGGATVASYTLSSGSRIPLPDDPAAPEGKRFDGWFKDGAEAAYNFSLGAIENVTLYARFSDASNIDPDPSVEPGPTGEPGPTEEPAELKSVKLSKDGKKAISKATVKKGKKLKLMVITDPAGFKTTFTFKSSKPKVASVSETGVVKGKKKGKTTITVTAANGMTAKIKVTVK